MRRPKVVFGLLAVALTAILPVGTSNSQEFEPVCITVESGKGWNWVANQFNPTITGAARDAFVRRIWAYEEEARLTAGELVCIDPNDPALTATPPTTTSTTTTLPPTTTTRPPTTTTTSTTTTSTTTSTTTTVAPTTTMGPTTTVVAGGDTYPIANIPSNYNTEQFVGSRLPVAASTAHEPSGNFRTLCLPSHLAYDDPIVNPGSNSAHLHLFFGNTSANRNSTYSSLRTTGNSTCEGGPNNRTGYWMPAVFDGQGRVVPPSLILLYYKGGASGGTLLRQQNEIRSVRELPNGLRMIAGAGGPEGTTHITWKCGDNSSQGNRIPDSCPTGYLIASVTFPDCWDGKNLDSVNHRSHMAYRTYGNDGIYKCPATHPVLIPTITEGFHWQTGATDVSEWSLSSDMGAVDGTSLHADWFGAWDNGIQTRWHTNCITGMRTSNNGDLCDGRGLTGWSWSGQIKSAARISGWTPMLP